MTALERLPFDLASLHAAYAQGVDPARVVEEAYRRIEAANDPGIFLHLVEPRVVIEQARALGPFDPERRPLHGLPFAIKDNIDAAGAPTTAACAAFDIVSLASITLPSFACSCAILLRSLLRLA